MKTPRVLYFLLTAALLLSATLQVGCTLPASLGGATPTPSASPTPEATATNTPRPTLTPRPTATPNATATAQYNDMVQFVQNAADVGYIDSTEGEYHRLDDYTDAMAQLNYYLPTLTGYSAANFVFRAHMKWDSASKTPDISGCGIIFRTQADAHYAFFVTSDGMAHFMTSDNGPAYFGGKIYHGQNKAAGELDFAMTAQGDTFNIFINGERKGAFYGHKDSMLDGKIAYTVISGTNKDYGTRCNITNAELWILK
jgi:hypothetical protein